jgi:hypothetical protein
MTMYDAPEASEEQGDPWVLGDLMPHDRDAILPEQAEVIALGGEFAYIGQGLTADEFTAYVQSYDFGTLPPTFVVLHHTAVPGASWAPSSSNWDANEAGLDFAARKQQRKRRLDGIMGFYQNQLGWDRGPHLFIDEQFIWLFSPMRERGIHAAEGNGAWNSYSIGIEVIGDFTNNIWPPAVEALVGHAVAVLHERLKTFELAYRPGVGAISSHRDYNKPSCPGNAVRESYYIDVIRRAHGRLLNGQTLMSQRAAVPLTVDAPLLGPDSGGIERCIGFIRRRLPADSEYQNDVELIMGYYWTYAPQVGLDPFLAAAQCIFETDSLTSRLASRAGGRNPAGLGVRQEGALRFENWEQAVQAHLGQLLAFALRDEQANEAQRAMMARNPRNANIPPEFRGAAPTVAGLSNRWTADPEYATKLINRANAILQG